MNHKAALVLVLFSWVILVLTSTTEVEARSLEVSEDSDLLQGILQETSGPWFRRKRQVFGVSCKGLLDTELYAKLNQACLDCQNIFRREPALGGKCRSNCFGNGEFESCVRSLELPVKKYMHYAALLRD